MAVPPGKTPISFLQELCTKRGITPQYDLLANEGAVHEPVFIMRVTVGEVIATGKGSSKKKAKHGAAQAALNQILGLPNGQGAGDACVEQQQVSEDLGPGNPVGDLQEFTQKKLIKPPVYEFTNEQGPPHAREFVCVIKLGKFQEKGAGRSKKAAKRAAAASMLQHIRSITDDSGNTVQIEEEEEDEISLKFYQKLMKQGGKQMKNLQGKQLNAPATNYCQMLQEIAEVQRFEVTYTDIPELSVSGQHQCLVQLTTFPVAVCHGYGPTIDEAHAQAAHNGLQYLKLMTKS